MIEYKVNADITAEQFVDLLNRSSLGRRRPVEDRECIGGMVKNASLLVTAWDGAKLVGVARSVTDFHYACFLSDLAVDAVYQRTGIGKALVAHTQNQLGPRCKIRLIAAPDAADYYRTIGFVQNTKCWELSGAAKLMADRMSTNLSGFPKDLPRPADDGAASHLEGTTLPDLTLPSTDGANMGESRKSFTPCFHLTSTHMTCSRGCGTAPAIPASTHVSVVPNLEATA